MNSEDIKSIVEYSLAMLFTENVNSIAKIKQSALDIEASLLSELTYVNSEIQDAINFSTRTICSEYIDFLIDAIIDTNNKTLENDKISALTNLTSNISTRITYSNDQNLCTQLENIQSRISSIIKYDIKKSVDISPISSSKVVDFVISARTKAEELASLCNNIRMKIKESDYLLEACSFCIYYLNKNYISAEAYPPLLEETRESIISILTKECIDWKGELQ